MGEGLQRAVAAARATRPKIVHLSVAKVGRIALTYARACDPTISTKSPLTTIAVEVTCSRCRLTLAYRDLIGQQQADTEQGGG